MHQVMDLMLIRYFQLVTKGGASENLRRINAGEEHSGLTAAELASPQQVLRKYHETLDELIAAVASGKLNTTPDPQGQPQPSRAAAHASG